jgi:hypothetical protein
MNFELKVKEILKENFILTGKMNSEDIINNLISFVKNNKDEELSYKTNVKGHFTGFKSLVNNEYFHGFLKLIKQEIAVVYKENKFIISDVWGNILKKGEEVSEHTHGNTAFSGVLYLTEGGPGTFFSELDMTIEEKIGGFILFSPMLKHSVKKIENDIERITVAFNMDGIKEWETEKMGKITIS